jgi:CubicO group peptidase (beta-lactamase class C family)
VNVDADCDKESAMSGTRRPDSVTMAFVTALAAALLETSAFVAPTSSQAKPPSDRHLAEEVESYLAPLVEQRDYSGVVLIWRGNRAVVDRAFGLANAELGVANRTTTRFAIGSVSKPFTAAGIQLLAARGKLSLSDPISRYVEDLPWGDKVTLQQLLAHRGGVPDYYSQPDYFARRSQPIDLARFGRWIGTKPLDFVPGKESRYSNSGYALLASVIERVSGQPYRDFLKANIFGPLGMQHTGDLTEAGIIGGLATGYNPGFPPERLQRPVTVDPSWLVGSGSIYSTSADLLRWAEAVQSRQPFRLDLQSDSFGWGKREVAGRPFIEQNGRIPLGYTSYLAVYPSDGLIVVVLSNVQVDIVERLGRDFAAISFGERCDRPTRRKEVPIAPARLADIVGRYSISPDLVLTVRASGGRPSLAGPEGDFLPLYPESENSFYFSALGTRISFLRDSSGKVVALDWGGQFKAEKQVQ